MPANCCQQAYNFVAFSTFSPSWPVIYSKSRNILPKDKFLLHTKVEQKCYRIGINEPCPRQGQSQELYNEKKLQHDWKKSNLSYLK